MEISEALTNAVVQDKTEGRKKRLGFSLFMREKIEKKKYET